MKREYKYIEELYQGERSRMVRLGQYHAQRIDSFHVFGVVMLDASGVKKAKEMEEITLLPVSPGKTIAESHNRSGMKKQSHLDALQAHGVLMADNADDAMAKIHDEFGNPQLAQ